MKFITIIIGIIITIGLVILILINTDQSIKFNFFTILTTDLDGWLLILISAFAGALCTSCYWVYYLKTVKEGKSKHERMAEKASIKAEESSDKVKVLEAKIQTLEEALKKALKDSKK